MAEGRTDWRHRMDETEILSAAREGSVESVCRFAAGGEIATLMLEPHLDHLNSVPDQVGTGTGS